MSDVYYPGELLLTRAEAKELAALFRRVDEGGVLKPEQEVRPDPFAGEIEASLLSAEDIKKYVLATGMISPFYVGRDKSSLLKDAAYEGRIGTKAYIFDPGQTQPRQLLSADSRVLLIPDNSIVFVECDLDFRIPEFIALRFNLQIKHVHRGLLLGTGPLVDPGYVGKLCIPLHNLTDEPYEIALDDGLIWIEFTRTTGNYFDEVGRLGRPPLGKEFWDIKEFLDKASSPVSKGSVGRVGIRSAIPAATKGAGDRAERAKASAEAARVAAAAAATSARNIGIGGGLAAVVGIASLLFSLYSLQSSYTSSADARLGGLSSELGQLREHVAELERVGIRVAARPPIEVEAITRIEDRLERVNGQLQLQVALNQFLRVQVDELRRSMLTLENQLLALNRDLEVYSPE